MADDQPAPPPTDHGGADDGGTDSDAFANRPQSTVPTQRTVPVGPIITLAGAGLVVLGSLLPWATLSSPFGTASIPGTRGDGQITLVLGILIGLGAAVLWWRRTRALVLRVLIGLLAVFVIVIGWSDMSGVTERLADTSEGAIGWLVLASTWSSSVASRR